MYLSDYQILAGLTILIFPGGFFDTIIDIDTGLVVKIRHQKYTCYNESALICAQTMDSILGPIANIDAEM